MSGSEYRVTNPRALQRAVVPMTARVAGEIARDTSALSPRRTGRLAGSYTIRRSRAGYEVGTSVEYARFVEYGTRDTPAQPAFGQAVARARSRYGR